MHGDLIRLLRSEWELLATRDGSFSVSIDNETLVTILLDVPQGLRRVLLGLRLFSDTDGNTVENITERLANELRMAQAASCWSKTHEFVSLLADSEGTVRDGSHGSRRHSLWRGVFLQPLDPVRTLNGSTPSETRVTMCAAFNSPLSPDILLCTSIGSEGIDLHLNCADVIHHDLPWNPAKLEQRIGRVDRVGSLATRGKQVDRVDIGIPFLACNYDEFQYKTVFSRAQRQEILLGEPDFTNADITEDSIDETSDSIAEPDVMGDAPIDDRQATSLPEKLIEFYRVKLDVSS